MHPTADRRISPGIHSSVESRYRLVVDDESHGYPVAECWRWIIRPRDTKRGARADRPLVGRRSVERPGRSGTEAGRREEGNRRLVHQGFTVHRDGDPEVTDVYRIAAAVSQHDAVDGRVEADGRGRRRRREGCGLQCRCPNAHAEEYRHGDEEDDRNRSYRARRGFWS